VSTLTKVEMYGIVECRNIAVLHVAVLQRMELNIFYYCYIIFIMKNRAAKGTSINYSKSATQVSFVYLSTLKVVNVWNHLHSDFVEFSTLSAFERTIKLVAGLYDYLNCF